MLVLSIFWEIPLNDKSAIIRLNGARPKRVRAAVAAAFSEHSFSKNDFPNSYIALLDERVVFLLE